MAEVRVETRAGVAWVWLNRPAKRNAMSPALNDAMLAALDTVESDESVAVLVLAGAGGNFSAGMDLKELELARFAARLRDTAGLADALDDVELGPPPSRSLLTYPALGVVALIVPWNWPLSILGAKLPQALLAGNAVVVKPAPGAPLATMRTLELVAAALPPGVVNAVIGTADLAGAALVRHPGVRKVDFTGGTENGKAVMAAAAPNLTRLTLELGGNDPALVLADVEVTPDLLARLARAAFLTSGQVCMAVKRLYVHRSRFAELVDGLGEVLSATRVGPGADPEATMGPLHHASQYHLIGDLLADARRDGATVREYGRLVDEQHCARGWFRLPALVTGAGQDSRLVRCEQFGPVLPVLPFADENEAVALANDSELGLCSSVWTADPERGLRLARRLQAGTTSINHHGPAAQDDRMPFGGVKHSGMGRQLGPHGVREFCDQHVITVYSSPADRPRR